MQQFSNKTFGRRGKPRTGCSNLRETKKKDQNIELTHALNTVYYNNDKKHPKYTLWTQTCASTYRLIELKDVGRWVEVGMELVYNHMKTADLLTHGVGHLK